MPHSHKVIPLSLNRLKLLVLLKPRDHVPQPHEAEPYSLTALALELSLHSQQCVLLLLRLQGGGGRLRLEPGKAGNL